MSAESGGPPAAKETPGAAAPRPPEKPESWFRALLAGFRGSLTIGPGPRAETGGLDVSTRLAYERTDLAVERSYMAAERTLMAWIRTALSMISFGFTIGKIGQTVASVDVKGWLRADRMVGVESIAYFLVILGTLALAAAIVQYARSVGEYVAMGLRRRISIGLIVGLILVVMGGGALAALVLRI
jgi:putative membrane protein